MESRRPPVLLLRGVKSVSQMNLSPVFPAQFEPLLSSWACFGLMAGAGLWCPGMGLLGSTEQSILSQSYVWGGSWRDKTSSEGLGSSILVKEGDEPESFLRAALP